MSVNHEIALDGGAVSTAFTINRIYVDGGCFQWAIEMRRNVAQVMERMTAAGLDTSKVEMKFDFVQPDVISTTSHEVVADAIKRRVWNVGTPMLPEEELLQFYSRLNVGGGSNRWSPENLGGSYGMGVRAAVLPWTDLMVITTIPGDGSYAVTLRGQVDDSGQRIYTIVRPVQFDEDGDTIHGDTLVRLAQTDSDETYYIRTDENTCVAMTADLVHDKVHEHGGVTMVLLGRGDYTEMVQFDPLPSKGESAKGLVAALKNRFVGGDFPVSAEYAFESESTSRVHGTRKVTMLDGSTLHIDSRGIKTLADWTNRAKELDPVYVDAHGTKVTPYLLPENHWHTGSLSTAEKDAHPTGKFEYRSDGTWGEVKTSIDAYVPFDGKGTCIIRFGGEMYAIREQGEQWSNTLKQWGIPEDRVARSTLLVIDAPMQNSIHDEKWGISQNSARSNITGPNGDALPFNTWQNAWLDAFPKVIRDRLRVAPPSLSRDIPEDEIARLVKRVLGGPGVAKKKKSPTIAVAAEPRDTNTTNGVNNDDGEVTVSAGFGSKPGGGGGPAAKQAKPAAEKAGGGIKVVKRSSKTPPPPQPEFLSDIQWLEAGYDPEQFVKVVLSGGEYEIYLNGGHLLMERQIEHFWTDERNGYFSNPSRKRIRDAIYRNNGGRKGGGEEAAKVAVIKEIQYVYRYDALANFLGAQSVYMDSKGTLNRIEFNDAITNGSMAMTIGLVGIYPQDASISSRINGLGGSGRS